MTTAESIMTKKLITVSADTSLQEAQDLMREKRLRHLPVVDQNDHIIGIFSKKDLVYVDDMGEIPVSCLMSSPVVTVSEELPLRSVVLKMLERKISCVLIADQSQHATGIITTDDLLWHLAHLLQQDEDQGKGSLLKHFNLLKVGELAQKVADAGV